MRRGRSSASSEAATIRLMSEGLARAGPFLLTPRRRRQLAAHQLLCELGARNRPAVEEALRLVALEQAEETHLLGELHAFGHDLEPEIVTERDDRANDLRVVGVRGQMLDER